MGYRRDESHISFLGNLQAQNVWNALKQHIHDTEISAKRRKTGETMQDYSHITR